MAQALIKYAVHKNKDGTFELGFNNLTKTEATEYLMLLTRQQDKRAEPVVNDDAAAHGPQWWIDPAQNGEDAFPGERVAKIVRFAYDHRLAQNIVGNVDGGPTKELEIDTVINEAAGQPVTGGPRFVAKVAHFDHQYEPGAFGVCKRCGGEKH